MPPEQLQYACDLINRNTRFDSEGVPVCKVGKPCNGRCIPHASQCGGENHNPTASTTTRVEVEKKYGNLSEEQKNKLAELMQRSKTAKAGKEQSAAQRGTLPAMQSVQNKKIAAAMEARRIATAQALRERQQAAAEAEAKKKLKV